MQKIIDDLTSPEWWFTVVVAAILVGLVGVYVARFLDSLWRRFTRMVTHWTVAETEKRQETVAHFSANPHLLPFVMLDVQMDVTVMMAFGVTSGVLAVGAVLALLSAGTGETRNVIPYATFALAFLSGIMSGAALKFLRQVRASRQDMWEIYERLQSPGRTK